VEAFLNHFLNDKLNKIETENCIGIWERFVLGVVGKLSGESNLIEFISQFSELRCGRY
jgi:hypothetical protein